MEHTGYPGCDLQNQHYENEKTNDTSTNKPDPKTTKLKLNPRNAEVRRNGASKEFPVNCLVTLVEGKGEGCLAS
jgi:hypothetical protein